MRVAKAKQMEPSAQPPVDTARLACMNEVDDFIKQFTTTVARED